jgi:hypothetical protein
MVLPAPRTMNPPSAPTHPRFRLGGVVMRNASVLGPGLAPGSVVQGSISGNLVGTLALGRRGGWVHSGGTVGRAH